MARGGQGRWPGMAGYSSDKGLVLAAGAPNMTQVEETLDTKKMPEDKIPTLPETLVLYQGGSRFLVRGNFADVAFPVHVVRDVMMNDWPWDDWVYNDEEELFLASDEMEYAFLEGNPQVIVEHYASVGPRGN